MTHRDAYALLLGVALLWAGNYPLAKIGLHELGPVTMSALRAVVAAPLLVLVSRLLEGPLPRLARRDLIAVVVLAVSGFVGQLRAVVRGPALDESGQRGDPGRGLPGDGGPRGGGVAARARVPGQHGRHRPHPRGGSVNRGDVIILVSQSLWVVYTLYSRANLSTFSPLQMLAGAHVVAAGLLLPMALVERPWQAFAHASWVGFSVVLYSALLGTPAHIAFYQAVRTVGPSRAAVFMNLIPFMVLGLSWLMLGEPIHWYHWVGAIGVIGGVVLTTRRSHPVPGRGRAG